MEFVKLRSFEEYQKLDRNERIELENFIIKEFEEKQRDYLIGYCTVCDRPTHFIIQKNKKGQINLKEKLFCEYCKLNNRKRFMLCFLKEIAQNSNSYLSVFMYEQITRFFKLAQPTKNIDLVGSEFLGYDKKSGQVIDKIRNEDAMNLSFDDNSFDVIVSNDLYEHVPDINKSLKEAYRVLKNSGTLLISIPFLIENTKTIRRATLEEGKIKHILEPIFHSNPAARKEGSLVFYDYGWDFLDFLKKAGFKDSYMLGYYEIFYGYIGKGLEFIFVAKK